MINKARGILGYAPNILVNESVRRYQSFYATSWGVMRITVVGSGYVDLVSGVSLAAKGHDVTCVDLRNDIVAQLNGGAPDIYEWPPRTA